MKFYRISNPIRIKDNQDNALDVSPIALKLLANRNNNSTFTNYDDAKNFAQELIKKQMLDPRNFACAIFEENDENLEIVAHLDHVDGKKYGAPINLIQYAKLTTAESFLIYNALQHQEDFFNNEAAEKMLKKNQPYHPAVPLIVGLVALSSAFLSYVIFNMGLVMSAGIAASVGLGLLSISQTIKEKQTSVTDKTKYHRQVLTVLTAKKERENRVRLSEKTIKNLEEVLENAPPASFNNDGALSQKQPPRNALQVLYWQEKRLAQIELLVAPENVPVQDSYWKTKTLPQNIEQIENEIEATANKLNTENSKLCKKSNRPPI